jgi:hypothetical protein
MSFLLLLSCGNNSNYNKSATTIDLTNPSYIDLSNPTYIDLTNHVDKVFHMSELFENVEYIKLETTPECLFFTSYTTRLYLTDKYIIVTDGHPSQEKAFLFNRTTGKYIKQIGSRGNGPNEYNMLIRKCAFDENENILYFDGINKWIGYNIESGDVCYVEKPTKFNLLNGYYPPIETVLNFIKLDSANYIGYTNNLTGKDTVLLSVFNNKGIISRTFRNYQTYIDHKTNFYPVSNGDYYQYKCNFYFFEETYNDTLYNITPHTIKPHAIFILGEKKPPYSLKESKEFDIQKYYSIRKIRESDLFFTFELWYKRSPYQCYFDKKECKAYICKNEFSGNTYVNDYDNFLYFSPDFSNNKGEFMTMLSAEDVTDFFKKNKRVSRRLSHLKNTKEDDNPVIVISKLK